LFCGCKIDFSQAIGVFSDDLHPRYYHKFNTLHDIIFQLLVHTESAKLKRDFRCIPSSRRVRLLGKPCYGMEDELPTSLINHRKWFLRPQLDQNILNERHEHVHHLLEPQNAELVYEFSTSCLKHVKDIPRILHRVKMVCSSVSDWYNLYQVSYTR
jgi:hypothetical protein